MGCTPIACIPPPEPTREELFRSEITPKPDRVTPIIGWTLNLLVAALLFTVVL